MTYTVTDENRSGVHESAPGLLTIKFLSEDVGLRRPVCGPTVYDPVFHDVPVDRVRLNYSVSASQYGNNNTNIYISKLMLLCNNQSATSTWSAPSAPSVSSG